MSGKSGKTYAYPEKLLLYDRLIAAVPGLQRKGASVPYTSLNGNMFSYLTADGCLALRLPHTTRETFLTTYQTSLVAVHGIVQKEYVLVEGGLLERTADLLPYFTASYEYAHTLKPKPTKREQ
jgi:hypothetical protein